MSDVGMRLEVREERGGRREEGGGRTHADAGDASPDGDGEGLARVGLGAGFDAVEWFIVEEEGLEDVLPFVGGAGRVARSEVDDAVVFYCVFGCLSDSCV